MKNKTWFIGAFLVLSGCSSAQPFSLTAVERLEDTVALDFSVSGRTTCARTSDTEVECVEPGATGDELVRWTATSSSTIEDMLYAGVFGVCLIDADHHLECSRDGEVTLAADDVVQMSLALCVRGTGGDVRCVGDNVGEWQTVIASGATDIAYPGDSTDMFCAVVEGALRCWGMEEDPSGPGHLGPGVDDAIDVELEADHGCVLREGGSVACWGLNDHGQLGGGAMSTDRVDEPIAVEGIDDAIALDVGYQQSCALRADGSVYCWGSLGPLGIEDTMVPTRVEGIEDAIALDGGCALTRSGQILCWSEPRW